METSSVNKADENGEIKQPVRKTDWKCPFMVRRIPKFVQEGENRMIPRITDQVKVDKETLTVSPVVETYDICEEVQTYKDQCGLEYFKLMLQQGKAHPEDSHDDGQHGVDMRMIPTTIHEASKAAAQGHDYLAELAKQAGVKDGETLTIDQLIQKVVDKVQANQAAKAQAAPTKEGDSK